MGSVTSTELKLKSLEKYFDLGSLNGNKIVFTSNYIYSPDNFTMDIKVKSPRLYLEVNNIDNVSANLSLDNNILNIKSVKFNINNYSVSSRAKIDIKNG